MRKFVCNIIENLYRNWIHGFENHLGISIFPSLFLFVSQGHKRIWSTEYEVTGINELRIISPRWNSADIDFSFNHRRAGYFSPLSTARLNLETDRTYCNKPHCNSNPTVINWPRDYRVQLTRHRVMNKHRLPNSLFISLFNGLSNCLKLNLLCIQVPY